MNHSLITSYKRFSTYILILMLLFASFSSAIAQGDLFTHVRFIGGDQLDYIYNALPLQNGNLLLVCGTYGGFDDIPPVPEWSSLGLWICMAPNGDIAWQKTYGDLPGQNVMVWPIQNEDGTFSAWTHHAVQQMMDSVSQATLSAEGDLLSTNKLDLFWPNISVIGQYYGMRDDDNETYQLKTPSGEIVHNIPIEKLNSRFSDHPLLRDDGLIYSSIQREEEINEQYGIPDVSNTVITRIDWSGTSLWQTTLPANVRHLLDCQSDRMLAFGAALSTPENNQGSAAGLAALLTADGQVLWQQEYPLSELQDQTQGFIDAVEIEEGFLLLYPSKASTTVNILLIDKQGTELARSSFRAEKEVYYSPNLVKTEDAVWLYSSVERRSTGDDIVIMKLNPDALRMKE